MKEKLTTLDPLRAFSCLIVFAFHSYIVSYVGPIAVSLFILMSGFLLFYNYADRVDSLPSDVPGCLRHALRKVGKLYPLYIISLVALVIRIIILMPDDPPRSQLVLYAQQFISSVFLVQSWYPGIRLALGLNVAAWYLSTALFLYFAFPFVLRRVLRIRSVKGALGWIVLIFALMVSSAEFVTYLVRRFCDLEPTHFTNIQHWLGYICPLYRLGDFSIGCILGFIFSRTDASALSPVKASFLELGALVLAVLSHFLVPILPTQHAFTAVFVPSASLLLFTFALGRGYISRGLCCAPVRLISDYSTEIFLIHFVVLQYITPLCNILPLPYNLQRVSYLIISILGTIGCVWLYRRLSRRFRLLAVHR